jgi:hypothetical protein
MVDGLEPSADVPERQIEWVIRSCGPLSRLAAFAVEQRGIGNSDGGFGLTYPADQDEADRSGPDGVTIPQGSVMIYGFWGPPDGFEHVITEALYLMTLARMLDAAGHHDAAASITRLAGERS